jgi:hypothetical protein
MSMTTIHCEKVSNEMWFLGNLEKKSAEFEKYQYREERC